MSTRSPTSESSATNHPQDWAKKSGIYVGFLRGDESFWQGNNEREACRANRFAPPCPNRNAWTTATATCETDRSKIET